MLPAWQVDPRGRPLASAATAAAPTALAASQAREQEQLPGTAAEFERAWRRRSTSERLELLRMVTPEQLPRIFRVEISAEVLGQIVQVLQQSWAAGAVLLHAGAMRLSMALAGGLLSCAARWPYTKRQTRMQYSGHTQAAQQPAIARAQKPLSSHRHCSPSLVSDVTDLAWVLLGKSVSVCASGNQISTHRH